MITLVVEGHRHLLGAIAGDGVSQQARMERSPLGEAVIKALLNIPQFYPAIEIWALWVKSRHTDTQS